MKTPSEKIDTELSSTSNNALANSTIYAELAKKLNLSGGTLTGGLYTRNLIPDVNDSRTLGNTTNRYKSLWINAIEMFGSTPYVDFHYNNSSSDYTARIIENSSGALTVYNSISNSSDKRLKNNIEDIDDKYIELLDNLEVKKYNFNNSELLDCGLVAQDVLEKEKELGIDESILIRGTGKEREIEKDGETKTEIDYYSLNYSNLTVLLLKKVQMLEKRIEELENKE